MGTVHVGIVTYNSADDLPDCMARLRAQTYTPYRIVIVDNASTDHTVRWLQDHAPDVPLIQNTDNVGFGRAHNQIVRYCAPGPDEFYLALNPDVRLEPDYIAELVDAITAHSAGWATGKLRLSTTGQGATRIYSAGHAVLRGGYVFNIGYGLPDNGRYDVPREIFGAPGAAPLYSAQLIADLAPDGALFDEALFMYGEDTDLDWRARRTNWRCWYAPQAVAYHRGSEARGTLRVEAMTNRYLSAIKNAYLIDLLTWNLPLMAVHCAARLLLTPTLGTGMIRRLIRLGPVMWRKRRPPSVSRETMLRWHRWSAAQTTSQPTNSMARFISFWQWRKQ